MNWKKYEDGFICPTVFATTENLDQISKQNIDLPALFKLNTNDGREFLCGWGAAIINVTFTYPINKVIFRQILEGVPATTAAQKLSEEGFRLLYRGIFPPLCQKTLSLSLMFSLYEGCRQRLCILTENKTFARIFAANFAGTCEAILMPLERIQTLLQDWRYHKRFKNTPHAFSTILREYGVTECYRGLVPIICRNGLSNLMFFSLREQSKEIMGHDNSLLTNFVSGALIGAFTSTMFYPVNVIKIHMQSKIGVEFESVIKCVRDVYIARDRSIKSFYKGVYLNFLRSFISWGVINASYDILKKVLF